MNRLLYISNSLIGYNLKSLNDILIQASYNNTATNLTGILWTDGERFVQVIEGQQLDIDNLLDNLLLDNRHADLQVIEFITTKERSFGNWSMNLLLKNTPDFDFYSARMIEELNKIQDRRLIQQFKRIMSNSFVRDSKNNS